jgi:hypothetical protein
VKPPPPPPPPQQVQPSVKLDVDSSLELELPLPKQIKFEQQDIDSPHKPVTLAGLNIVSQLEHSLQILKTLNGEKPKRPPPQPKVSPQRKSMLAAKSPQRSQTQFFPSVAKDTSLKKQQSSIDEDELEEDLEDSSLEEE